MLNYIVSKLKAGVITFINAVILANHDYPLHDYKKIEDGSEPTAYAVGTDNRNGDQRKLFVSKSTLVYSDVACTLRWNNDRNVTQDIIANTWYTFRANIRSVHVITIATDGTLYLYFEGVLPEEVRIGA